MPVHLHVPSLATLTTEQARKAGNSTRHNALLSTLSLDEALQEITIPKPKYNLGKALEALEELLYGALYGALKILHKPGLCGL